MSVFSNRVWLTNKSEPGASRRRADRRWLVYAECRRRCGIAPRPSPNPIHVRFVRCCGPYHAAPQTLGSSWPRGAVSLLSVDLRGRTRPNIRSRSRGPDACPARPRFRRTRHRSCLIRTPVMSAPRMTDNAFTATEDAGMVQPTTFFALEPSVRPTSDRVNANSCTPVEASSCAAREIT